MKKQKALRRQELAAEREAEKIEHKQELNRKRQERWRNKRRALPAWNALEAARKRSARKRSKQLRVQQDLDANADLFLMECPAVPLECIEMAYMEEMEEEEPLVIPWRTKRRAPETPPASPCPWDSPEDLD